MPDREIITSISSYYPLQILKEYNNDPLSTKSLEIIAKSLKEIYRYFEPAFFTGDFYMCRQFEDSYCFPLEKGAQLFDKNILLNKTHGTTIIQAFSDGNFYIWEGEDPSTLFNNPRVLTYRFNLNKDYFIAMGNEIDVTISPKGSRYAPQFVDLLKVLDSYKRDRIYHSSCPTFKNSWHDNNRIFFRSEGSGNNIPEKFMQESLFEFLRVQDSLRGISMENLREFNVNPGQPKPIDIRIQWKEANRVALIEMKWIGAVKSSATGKTTSNNSPRQATPGYIQLKGYYDSALRDLPNTIIKSHLVVIDGRRNNVKGTTTTISYANGMHFKDAPLEIDEANRYYESIPGFEFPIKMFAAPICI